MAKCEEVEGIEHDGRQLEARPATSSGCTSGARQCPPEKTRRVEYLEIKVEFPDSVTQEARE